MEAVLEKPELIQFRKQDAAIAELAAKYGNLRINGLDDKKGFADVHNARMEVKSTRVAVEKKRVELKADALAYGKAVDSEAKRLFAMLEPIETHLEAEENVVVEAREKIKRAAEEARRVKLQHRLDCLAACGIVGNPQATEAMSDEAFDSNLATVRTAFEERINAERIAAEKRKAEEVALAAERERLAAIQKAQHEESARLEAEKRKLEQAERERQHQIELEKARQEAAERAKAEAERKHAEQQAREKAAAEAKAAKEKAEDEVAEAARMRAEQERPHRERILSVAVALDATPVPEGPLCEQVSEVLRRASAEIRKIATGEIQ